MPITHYVRCAAGRFGICVYESNNLVLETSSYTNITDLIRDHSDPLTDFIIVCTGLQKQKTN